MAFATGESMRSARGGDLLMDRLPGGHPKSQVLDEPFIA